MTPFAAVADDRVDDLLLSALAAPETSAMDVVTARATTSATVRANGYLMGFSLQRSGREAGPPRSRWSGVGSGSVRIPGGADPASRSRAHAVRHTEPGEHAPYPRDAPGNVEVRGCEHLEPVR